MSRLCSLKNGLPGGAMRFRLLAIFSASALVLAACGGTNEGPTDAAPGPDAPAVDGGGDSNDGDSNDEEASESVGGPAGGGSGAIVVDGEQMSLNGVIRCIPFDAGEFGGAEGDPNEIDLAIIGETGMLGVNSSTVATFIGDGSEKYDMSVNRVSLSLGADQYENVAGTLVDGTWILGNVPLLGNPGEGTTAIDGPPFTVDGDNISGTMTLVQTWPEGADGTVDVTFDVIFPSEQQEC